MDLEKSWPSPNETVDVYIHISFSKVYDIDTIAQRFHAEALIESKWHDPTVRTIEEKIDDKKIWKPEIYIENGIKDVQEEVNYRAIFDRKIGKIMICEIKKVKGYFYENLELENFPLDIQSLSFLVATKKPGNTIKFNQLQERIYRMTITNFLDKSMWRMHDLLITRDDKVVRELSYGILEYPALKVTAQVFRLPGFFYWNVVLPILLVQLASVCPFVVDPKAYPQSRLASAATLLLTSVNIRWVIGRLLPTVSYLTSLDKYSLASISLIVLQLIYHAFMAAIFTSLPDGVGYRVDKLALAMYMLFILLMQILFIFWIRKRTNHRKLVQAHEILYSSTEDLTFGAKTKTQEYEEIKSQECKEKDHHLEKRGIFSRKTKRDCYRL